MSGTNSNTTASGPADANTPTNTSASSSTFQPRSKYRIVKDEWGSRTMFQSSHGLKMSPDDLEEGNLILEGYQMCERVQWEADQEQRASGGKQVDSAAHTVFFTFARWQTRHPK